MKRKRNKKTVKLTCFVTEENREYLNEHDDMTATDVINCIIEYCRTNNIKFKPEYRIITKEKEN